MGVYMTLGRWLFELKREACEIGRFPETRRGPFWFDVRGQCIQKEGWKPFRSIGYNQLVRRINCLEMLIKCSPKNLEPKLEELKAREKELNPLREYRTDDEGQLQEVKR